MPSAQAGLSQPLARSVEGARDAEVGHQSDFLIQQNVLGLDVPVDDTLRVGVVEGLGDLAGDPDSGVDRERAVPIQPFPHRGARDVRHGEVANRAAIRERDRGRVMDGENVAMGEPAGHRDFSREAPNPHGAGQLGPEHLERNRAVMLDVLGEIDRGHPAPAQLALELIAIAEGGLKLRRC